MSGQGIEGQTQVATTRSLTNEGFRDEAGVSLPCVQMPLHNRSRLRHRRRRVSDTCAGLAARERIFGAEDPSAEHRPPCDETAPEPALGAARVAVALEQRRGSRRAR